MHSESQPDLEQGNDDDENIAQQEQQSLLPTEAKQPLELQHDAPTAIPTSTTQSRLLPYAASFTAGILACLVFQYLAFSCPQATPAPYGYEGLVYLAPEHAGSTVVHNYPPASPTNAIPSYFPTNVGYPGATPTGAEAAMIATAPAYPFHKGAPVLLRPTKPPSTDPKKKFDIFKYWGNLSPCEILGFTI